MAIIEKIAKEMHPWLNAQRIGVAAYGAMVLPPLLHRISPHEDPQKYEEHREIYEEFLYTLKTSVPDHFDKQSDPQYQQHRLMQLPPSVLYLLDTALTKAPLDVPENIQSLKGPIQEALARLDKGEEGNPDLWQQAQILAYHVMDSMASASRIASLGLSFSRGTPRRRESPWKDLSNDKERLKQIDSILEKLRAPYATTRDLLSNICQLGPFLQETPEWLRVANILFSQAFCWPLLVSRFGEYEVGISLPVAVDIDFDDARDVILEDDGKIDLSKWHKPLEETVDKAKTLWLAKHKNHGIDANWRNNPNDFRRKIDRASVTFNFQWTDYIFHTIPKAVPIEDDSATTYFAMAVLAKLLGRRSYLSSAVTGQIREKCKEENSQREEEDFRVEPAKGLHEKLRYLFAARTFERVALPKGSEDEVGQFFNEARAEVRSSPERKRKLQTSEIAYGAKLSHLADIVQTGGWRQYRYIRCPELQWAIHEKYYAARPGLIRNIDDPAVQRILNLLQNNSTSVLDLQDEEGLTPRKVASTLWYINMTVRSDPDRSHLTHIPPMFSSLFIRATHDQQDSRFWEVIWKAIGASMEEFQQLYFAPSPKHAAAKLGSALNCFQPSEMGARGHRAPDIIVIIGAKLFQRSLETTANPLGRNLAVMRVLHDLSSMDLLRVAPTAEDLSEFLGKTRIILLSDCPADDMGCPAPEEALERLHQNEQAALSALSTFRWGFNHTMASLMLNSQALEDYEGTWGPMRTFLRDLAKKGLLRYSQGWYHLPPSLRERRYQALWKASKMKLAEYHLSAGSALAPYTLESSVSALAYDQAFLPENIYEAFFHFDRANWLANDEGHAGKKWNRIANTRMERLLRFAAFPSLSTIGKLTDSPQPSGYSDAYGMGKKLIEKREKDPIFSIHPGHYLLVANCGLRWLNAENNQDTKEILDKELVGPEGLFEKARKACEDTHFKTERKFNLSLVLSTHANYLAKKGSENLARARVLDGELLQLLAAPDIDARGVQGEWFERLGDEKRYHHEAAHLYKLGVHWVREWHQLWVKALGAASLAKEDYGWVTTSLQEYNTDRSSRLEQSFALEETVVHIISKAGHRPKPSAPWIDEQCKWKIKERWYEGIRISETIWGYSPEVRRVLRELKGKIDMAFNSVHS